MTMNPFDDENGTFHVVVNDDDIHAVWPAFIAVPAGWRTVGGARSRQSCVDYIEENWKGMRLGS
jgi:MbtH protein